MTGLSPEQIASIAHGDVQNAVVKNQTLGNVFGMFDKQQDNIRSDQTRLDTMELARQKQTLEWMKAKALMNKEYAQAALYDGQLKRVDTLMQSDLADVGYKGAAAQNQLDQVGSHGQRLTTKQMPDGSYHKMLLDKTGRVISDLGIATPHDLGEASLQPKVLPYDAGMRADEALRKSMIHTDKEGKVIYKDVIPSSVIDEYNRIADKVPGMQKKQLIHFDPYDPEGFGDFKAIDIVVPSNPTNEDVINQLMKVRGYSYDEAVRFVRRN